VGVFAQLVGFALFGATLPIAFDKPAWITFAVTFHTQPVVCLGHFFNLNFTAAHQILTLPVAAVFSFCRTA
jgi:hypothetical protein